MADDLRGRPLEGSIAILGWGSLIWDLDDLAPHVRGTWRMACGPRLPLEFSRISPKRAMSLVVVIDPRDGVDCPTHAIASVRTQVEEAAEDLRRRERAPDPSFIGALCARRGILSSAHAEVADRVAAWCAETGAAGAVWTDLPRNFETETGGGFTIDAALAYLRGLPPGNSAVARAYIDGAPRETDTPLRRRLAEEPWWTAVDGATA